VIIELSELDAQLLVIKNINPIYSLHIYKKLTRVINYATINEFNIKYFSSEDWELVYNGNNMDLEFSSFLNILRIFVKKKVPF
jgi:hypothetical protein